MHMLRAFHTTHTSAGRPRARQALRTVSLRVALGGAAWILAIVAFAGHLFSESDSTWIVIGGLTLLGAVLTRPAWPARRLAQLGLALVALVGITQVLVGLTPVGIRLPAALVAGVGANVAILLLGCVLWQARWQGWAAVAGGLFGLLGILGGLAFGLTVGAMLNLATSPELVWLAALGSVLLANAAHLGSRGIATLHPVRRSYLAAVTPASWVAAAWAFAYALYRAYYAAGGTFGMFGVPVSQSQWRLINGVGALILLLVAVAAPVATWTAGRRPSLRAGVFAMCWIMTVAFVMHALIDMLQRVLSLSGLLVMDLPFWASIDQRASDLHDLLFNEPWFLIEGLLWVVVAWSIGVQHTRWRGWWIATAVIAILACTVTGLLSATGVIGRAIFV